MSMTQIADTSPQPDGSSLGSRIRGSASLSITLVLALALPAVVFFLPFGTFATITALPAHPLVVHAVVVFAPISLLLVLGAVFMRRWRPALQWAAVGSLVITAVTSIIAKSSGDSLAAAIGLPEQHARWGNYLVTASLITLGATAAWVWCSRVGLPVAVLRTFAGLVVIGAAAMGGVTYAAGHSGAEEAWAGTFEQARAPIASPQERQRPISLQEVAQHDSASDCWSVVEGVVYDLTAFIERHPAGSQAVIEMCGIDATADFMSEHAGPGEPREWLEVFRVGELRG